MYILKDDAPRKIFPLVNYSFIILNILVFVLQMFAFNFGEHVNQYGFVPASFNIRDITSYPSIFTSMFMHGNFMHIFMNMWWLHIFGDNVEDRLGHVRYFFFYLLAGVVASLTHYFFNMHSSLPAVGASGAIAGVAGMYFIYFGTHMLHVSRSKSIQHIEEGNTTQMHVWEYLIFWIATQLIMGSMSIFETEGYGGVAWFAHIGGFVFGAALADLTDKTDHYPWNKRFEITLKR